MERNTDRFHLFAGESPKRVLFRIVKLREGQRQVIDRLAQRLRVDREPIGCHQMPAKKMSVHQKHIDRRSDLFAGKKACLTESGVVESLQRPAVDRLKVGVDILGHFPQMRFAVPLFDFLMKPFGGRSVREAG